MAPTSFINDIPSSSRTDMVLAWSNSSALLISTNSIQIKNILITGGASFKLILCFPRPF